MIKRQLSAYWFSDRLIQGVVVFLSLMASDTTALCQGTINFNSYAGLNSTYYHELGMGFQVVIPGGTAYDEMGILFGADNTPRNGTAFMLFYRQENPLDYVAFNLTNGSTFGLASIDLADPTAPSPSPVSISFLGFKPDGSTVTNTFTTPGSGASTFLNYQFTPAFSSGLVSVKIDATRWAMDNLVFTVPEPSAVALVAIGLFGMMLKGRNAVYRAGHGEG